MRYLAIAAIDTVEYSTGHAIKTIAELVAARGIVDVAADLGMAVDQLHTAIAGFLSLSAK